MENTQIETLENKINVLELKIEHLLEIVKSSLTKIQHNFEETEKLFSLIIKK